MGFTDEVARVAVADVRPLLPRHVEPLTVEIEIPVDGNAIVERVELTTTELPRRGGIRWWWLCPACGSRRLHLYLVGRVCCRDCAGLKYRWTTDDVI